MGSLDGIRVIDFTHMIAGPLSTMLLADLGADVIKVEPAEGETARHLGDKIVDGGTDYFVALNRNKRSIVLDLKSPKDIETVKQLIAGADVVVENFRAGTAERLGFGYETLSKANPGLIYCAVSGFGPTGPGASKPAVDPIVQALSGIMQLTGTKDSGPLKTGFPLGDYVSPLFATIGILSALYERRITGRGKRVDVAMLDALVFSMVPREGLYFARGKEPSLHGNAHAQMVPANSYFTADGRQIYVFCHTEKFWRALVEVLGDDDLANNPRYKSNTLRLLAREEVDAKISAAFGKQPLSYWLPRIDAADASAAPIRTFPEVFGDPEIYKNMVADIEHGSGDTVRVLRTPICFDGERPAVRTPPPLLGEHTNDVLMELAAAVGAATNG
jgi:CoA:oxalate CoA-transferase